MKEFVGRYWPLAALWIAFALLTVFYVWWMSLPSLCVPDCGVMP